MNKLKWFKQEKPYSCGAACLRMVLNYYEIEVSETELRLKSKTKPDIGVHPISLIATVKDFGLDATLHHTTLDELQNTVEKNIPVIAFITKTTEGFFYHHTVVVEAFSKKQVIVLDPEEGRVKIDKTLFELAWSSAGKMALLVKMK